MNELLLSAVFLLVTHFGISSTSLRPQTVQAIGENLYRILYSVVALVAIIWLVRSYNLAPYVPLWVPGSAGRHIALSVMPLALLLVVSAFTAPNPTAVGQHPDADAPEPARGMLRVTRHPFLYGAALWAILHIIANGDLASLIFFGALAVLSLLGALLIDRKRTRANEPGWGIFMQRTSNLPFLAIAQRRQRLALREIGLVAPVAAIGLYVALLILHPWLFGVAVLA